VTAPSVPELPFVDDVIEVAITDLDSSRALLQRLLAIQDALLATTLTIVSLLLSLGFTNDRAAVVLLALPVVVVLACVDATTRVHFQRVSERIARLETLLHHYVVALRELRTARPTAVRNLRRSIDAYQFGVERAFEHVSAKQLRRANGRVPRWWLYPGMAALIALCALVMPVGRSPGSSVCIETAGGGVARVNEPPEAVSGSVTIVPCPGARRGSGP